MDYILPTGTPPHLGSGKLSAPAPRRTVGCTTRKWQAGQEMSLRVGQPLRGWCRKENDFRALVSKASRLRIAGKMPATHTASLATTPLFS